MRFGGSVARWLLSTFSMAIATGSTSRQSRGSTKATSCFRGLDTFDPHAGGRENLKMPGAFEELRALIGPQSRPAFAEACPPGLGIELQLFLPYAPTFGDGSDRGGRGPQEVTPGQSGVLRSSPSWVPARPAPAAHPPAAPVAVAPVLQPRPPDGAGRTGLPALRKD